MSPLLRALTFVVAFCAAMSAWNPPTVSAQPPASEAFLAVDPYVAWNRHVVAIDEPAPAERVFQGWEAGATVRFARRWLGVTGAVSRTSRDQLVIRHFLVGPHLATSYGEGRLFAHALFGHARFEASTVASRSGFELVVGSGVDLVGGVFRIEFDYVRVNLEGVPKNDGRLIVGAVIPLCFVGCRPGRIGG